MFTLFWLKLILSAVIFFVNGFFFKFVEQIISYEGRRGPVNDHDKSAPDMRGQIDGGIVKALRQKW